MLISLGNTGGQSSNGPLSNSNPPPSSWSVRLDHPDLVFLDGQEMVVPRLKRRE